MFPYIREHVLCDSGNCSDKKSLGVFYLFLIRVLEMAVDWLMSGHTEWYTLISMGSDFCNDPRHRVSSQLKKKNAHHPALVLKKTSVGNKLKLFIPQWITTKI